MRKFQISRLERNLEANVAEVMFTPYGAYCAAAATGWLPYIFRVAVTLFDSVNYLFNNIP